MIYFCFVKSTVLQIIQISSIYFLLNVFIFNFEKLMLGSTSLLLLFQIYVLYVGAEYLIVKKKHFSHLVGFLVIQGWYGHECFSGGCSELNLTVGKPTFEFTLCQFVCRVI